ncbi:MAG TPA: ACP S-malonyltransferase [Kofleriaceae bacterium]|jgi:[acyl-carrier-protein] S-malonyltransferase|nr:ACP S-malonyltransferase [Kofleriaceae bacterium]
MTTAFVFAGQGVDPPWIAPDLLARPRARPLLDAASEAAGCDARSLLLRGGAALARTEVLQPALVAACLVAADALAEAGAAPDVVCGHSLGELAAWAAGGHVAATDAIAAAGVRGRLMARQAARHPGGMAVAAGDAGATLEQVLAVGRARGRLTVAGYNTPTETTLSGDAAALSAIAALGCRRLPVAGAWHSDAMADAVDELGAALAAIVAPRRTGRGVPLVCNRDGRVAGPDELPALLAAQLVRPVLWTACTRTLAALGVTRFVAVGPGRLVRALLRANLGAVDVRIVDSMRGVAQAVAP